MKLKCNQIYRHTFLYFEFKTINSIINIPAHTPLMLIIVALLAVEYPQFMFTNDPQTTEKEKYRLFMRGPLSKPFFLSLGRLNSAVLLVLSEVSTSLFNALRFCSILIWNQII